MIYEEILTPFVSEDTPEETPETPAEGGETTEGGETPEGEETPEGGEGEGEAM